MNKILNKENLEYRIIIIFEGFVEKTNVYFRETLNYILFKIFSIAITFLAISEFRDKKNVLRSNPFYDELSKLTEIPDIMGLFSVMRYSKFSLFS